MKRLFAAIRNPLFVAGFFVFAGNSFSPSGAFAQESVVEYSATENSAALKSEPSENESLSNLSPEMLAPIESLVPSTPVGSTPAQNHSLDLRGIRDVELPSELPSGNAVNDQILFTWYPARSQTSQPTPAVILLHPLARTDQSPMHEYARHLAARGIAAAVLTLPYHGRRLPKDDNSFRHFVSPDATKVVSALQQSVSDARSVVTWMSAQPSVNPQKIGGIGISIGAIVLHLVMGQDARVKAGVAALGGGALAETYRGSAVAQSKFLFRLFAKSGDFGKVDPATFALLDQVDPLTFARGNQPRRVLMIEAARDVVVPPRSAEVLWEALGRPPIQWVDTNHFSLFNLGNSSMMRASVPYLQSVWNGAPLAARDIPKVHAPTLKFGFVMNLDSTITPAVQWQVFGLGTTRHRALLNANLGMSGRGPFVGVAATVTSYLDIGLARRFAGNRIRPYASLHFVY